MLISATPAAIQVAVTRRADIVLKVNSLTTLLPICCARSKRLLTIVGNDFSSGWIENRRPLDGSSQHGRSVFFVAITSHHAAYAIYPIHQLPEGAPDCAEVIDVYVRFLLNPLSFANSCRGGIRLKAAKE